MDTSLRKSIRLDSSKEINTRAPFAPDPRITSRRSWSPRVTTFSAAIPTPPRPANKASAYTWRPIGLAALGERERSRQFLERALAIRPDDPMLLYNAGCIFAMLGLPCLS
jgi:tetratricopeptide (TPR) repeat protein